MCMRVRVEKRAMLHWILSLTWSQSELMPKRSKMLHSGNHFFHDCSHQFDLLANPDRNCRLFWKTISISELNISNYFRQWWAFCWPSAVGSTCHCVRLSASTCFIHSYCSLLFFFSQQLLFWYFFFCSHLNINSTMTPTPPVGSCRTRSATTPTCVASWNFCTASLLSLTTVPPSLGPSCFSSGRPTSSVGWALLPMGIQTMMSVTQSITGLPTVDHPIWKPSSCLLYTSDAADE